MFGAAGAQALHQRGRCADGACTGEGGHADGDGGIRRVRTDSRIRAAGARRQQSDRRRRRRGARHMSISGPFNPGTTADTPARQKILTCKPANARDEEPCARRILVNLTRRAYRGFGTRSGRRSAAGDLRQGTRRARLRHRHRARARGAAVVAEVRVAGRGGPLERTRTASYRLSDLELASRLSFFLWKSIPDDELLQIGRAPAAERTGGPCAAGRRMLRTSDRTRFLNDFSGQWLEVRNISTQQPAQQFQFDPTLREAMARETELFFQSQVRDDRPIQDLLRANYTFLNERLAQHYGIAGVFGSHFRRVTLTDEDRFGLLGQGERPDGDVVQRPDVGRSPRLLDPRRPARRAAAAAAAERAAAQGERSARQAGGAARADGTASQQRRVRELPRADGSARLRARALRRRRPLPRDRRRRAHRFRHRVPRRPGDQSEGLPRGAPRPRRRGGADGLREDADLRARPRTQLSGCAGGPPADALAARQRVPVVDADPGHRPERSVPDAGRGTDRRRAAAQ